MLQINQPIDTILKAAGEQKITESKYRLFTYIQTSETNDGLLVYNLMTRELVLLNDDEAIAFENTDMTNETVAFLAKHWFLVPNSFNDYTFFTQVDSLIRMIADNDKNSPLYQFVIYPTTDCNARCFYCFELACKRITMTEQTAHDVADFIRRKSQGKKVHIMWFGGEPLYNLKAIDTITCDLVNSGIEYDSEMVSNGYLFDEDIVKKAFEFWKLKKIQITLDGTEEVYNRCKAYIYKNIPSPFVRVLSNIELLLKAGIHVNIRLNMDTHNCDDLFELTNQLVQRFDRYDNCQVYIALLFEKSGKKYTKRSLENKKLLWAKYDEVNDLLIKHNKARKTPVEVYRAIKHCMADNNGSTTILPDGNLGKCEHFTDDNFYGSIYSDKYDEFYIEKFKKIKDYGEQCHNCPLHPKCKPLDICPHTELECDEFDRELKIKYLKEQMLASYEYYLKNKNRNAPAEEYEPQFIS